MPHLFSPAIFRLLTQNIDLDLGVFALLYGASQLCFAIYLSVVE